MALNYVQVLDTLAGLEGHEIGVLVYGAAAESWMPRATLAGRAGAVEMATEKTAGESQGVAFLPVGDSDFPSVGWQGVFLKSTDFERAELLGSVLRVVVGEVAVEIRDVLSQEVS
jgi:hypothetical protein